MTEVQTEFMNMAKKLRQDAGSFSLPHMALQTNSLPHPKLSSAKDCPKRFEIGTWTLGTQVIVPHLNSFFPLITLLGHLALVLLEAVAWTLH